MNRYGSNKIASSFQKSAKYLNIISTNKFINFNYSSIEINRLPPWYKNHNFYRYRSQIIDILESSGSFQNLLNIYQIRNDSRQGTSCCYSSSRSLFFSLKQTLNTLQGNRLYLEPTILNERSSTIFGQRRGKEGERKEYIAEYYIEKGGKTGQGSLLQGVFLHQHSISTRVTKMGITNGTSYKSGAQLCVNHQGINVLSKHHTLDSLISEMHPLFRMH